MSLKTYKTVTWAAQTVRILYWSTKPTGFYSLTVRVCWQMGTLLMMNFKRP